MSGQAPQKLKEAFSHLGQGTRPFLGITIVRAARNVLARQMSAASTAGPDCQIKQSNRCGMFDEIERIPSVLRNKTDNIQRGVLEVAGPKSDQRENRHLKSLSERNGPPSSEGLAYRKIHEGCREDVKKNFGEGVLEPGRDSRPNMHRIKVHRTVVDEGPEVCHKSEERDSTVLRLARGTRPRAESGPNGEGPQKRHMRGPQP
jgi:hypothetical protein